MHLILLILQIGIIIIAARAVGWLFRRVQQPQVVGEMAAGILLGPSVLGLLAPDVSAALFPPDSLGLLGSLSQVGLLVFMFLVGLEFDPRLLRGRGHAAVVTSHVSIIVPFFLGAVLALYLYPRLSDASVSFTGFALFMGAAMSVTAFPVLARILTERNLLQTRVGTVTIACAAVDDVTAWTILALVVAVVRSSGAETPLWLTIAGTSAYLALMILLVRRALGWLEMFYLRRGRLTQDMIGAVLLLLLASSAATEWLGIHALFGAFALGAVMPKERGFVHDLSSKLEDFTVVFLLPIFFALTGLKTSIGLVSGEEMWGYAGLVLAVAVAGKFGGSAIAARVTGLDWRESGALGILMNTRGLMELVILTIGLELGVISPALFAMMVLMALVTTAMTTPVLELLYPARLIRQVTAGDVEAEHEHTVLLPISLPSSGPGLLRAALALAPEGRLPRIYALYLERASNQPQYGAQALEDVLRPVLEEAAARGVEVRPLSFVTRDPARDIIDVARVRRADLVLMGWHKPILGKSILSGTVSAVLRGAPADAAVLVDRGGAEWQSILVPYRDPVADRAALEMARRIAAAGPARVTILHVVTPERRTGGSLSRSFEEHAFPDGVTLKVIESDSPVDAAVREAREGYDLIVVGASRSWGTAPTALGQRHEELARAGQASLLVVRGGDVETEPADAEVRGLAASAAAS